MVIETCFRSLSWLSSEPPLVIKRVPSDRLPMCVLFTFFLLFSLFISYYFVFIICFPFDWLLFVSTPLSFLIKKISFILRPLVLFGKFLWLIDCMAFLLRNYLWGYISRDLSKGDNPRTNLDICFCTKQLINNQTLIWRSI